MQDLFLVSGETVCFCSVFFFSEAAMDILRQQPKGGFVVRNSRTSPGSYSLTVKAPNGKLISFLVKRNPDTNTLSLSVSMFDVHLTFNAAVSTSILQLPRLVFDQLKLQQSSIRHRLQNQQNQSKRLSVSCIQL